LADLLDITGNFDGGNPKNPDSIIRTGRRSFTVVPFSEDNDPNYKFRLDIKVFNHTVDTIKLDLTIDWQEPRFNSLRDYVYLKHASDPEWTYVSMDVNGSETEGRLHIPPGETYVCLHPKYSYGDYLKFVAAIEESEFIKKEKIGQSAEGREIWMVKIGGEIEHDRKKIMLVARIHPYESAGSYCIEGIVNHFLKTLSPFPFHISPIYLIPMANPDGVFNGLCKRTGRSGTDASKILDMDDPTTAAIKAGVDAVRPHIYCELHNWMFKNSDGIYYLNRFQAWRFKRMFPSQKLFGKRWRTLYRMFFRKTPPVGFKKYCLEKFHSICIALEFPWFRRSVEDMRRIGVHTAHTLAKTL
jgi:hypothetical protein